jgi:hypothetical protein
MADLWTPAVLVEGDTLASLEDLYSVDAVTIAERNGVAPAAGRKKSCAWGRDVDAWVLRTGGRRLPYDPRSPWVCSPGDGFASFVAGQVILLPAGGPRVPPQKPSTTTKKKTTRWGWWLAGGGVVATAAVVLLGGER